MAASISFRSFAGVVAIDRDRVVTDAMLTAGIETAAGIVNSLGDMPLTDRETSVSLSSGIVRVRLSDEGGRIDINKAPIKVLASLLRSVGFGDATADSIVQGIEGWRAIVSDSPMSINVPPTPNMAGQSAAPQQPAPSTPMQTGTLAPQSSETKDVGLRAFTDTRQLALIPGMTPEYLAAIGPLTTVFGYEKINGHTASREVMTALPDLAVC
jgi:general secretion pathway protein K